MLPSEYTGTIFFNCRPDTNGSIERRAPLIRTFTKGPRSTWNETSARFEAAWYWGGELWTLLAKRCLAARFFLMSAVAALMRPAVYSFPAFNCAPVNMARLELSLRISVL